MGQQQILLVVLSMIIVGIAIIVGIETFGNNATAANKDSVIADLNNLVSIALQHYKKPVPMGGGGNSFNNWNIPAGLDSSLNGTYSATPSDQTLFIIATGTELGNDGSTPILVHANVTPTTFIFTIMN